MKTFLITLAMALCPFLLRAEETVIYDPARGFAEGWSATATAGITLHETPEGLELHFDAFAEGGYEWPRLLITSGGKDLSDASRLIVEVEPLSDRDVTVLLSAHDSNRKRGSLAGISGPIATGGTRQIALDIADGAPLEQSEVREIAFGQHKPSAASRLRLRSIRAIAHPDFIPSRVALAGRLAEAGRLLAQTEEAVKDPAALEALKKRYRALTQAQEKRGLRYLSAIEERLLEMERDLSRLAIQERGESLVVWRSPLSQAIRRGTLPLPGDAALKQIRERVAVGQYRAVGLNFSSAESARRLSVKLKLSPELSGRVWLRPTEWAKARDGSWTADAIGATVGQVDLEVAPYETEQVLLWLDAKSTLPPAGSGHGEIELFEEGKPIATFPLEVEWVDAGLPAHLPLMTGNWAYFYTANVRQIHGLEKEARDNLRDYGMNTWVIHYTQIPQPQLDAEGRYAGLEPASLAAFEKVMELLKGEVEENYVFWLGFQQASLVERLSSPGVLPAYLREFNALIDRYGVAKERRYLKFWDEPKKDQILETIRWMEAVRKEDLGFKLFDNGSMVPAQEDQLQAYLEQTDVWVPNWEALFINKPDDAKRARAALKHRIGFYRCLMTRNNRGVNLYEYYRLNGWRLLEGDFSAYLNWVYVFAIGEKNAWDGTTGHSSGGQMIYVRDGQIWTSRRWEMVREALDDCRLAFTISDTPSRHPAIRELAQQALAAPTRPALADELREQLLDLALKP